MQLPLHFVVIYLVLKVLKPHPNWSLTLFRSQHVFVLMVCPKRRPLEINLFGYNLNA